MKLSAALLPLTMGNSYPDYNQAMLLTIAAQDEPQKIRSNVKCAEADLGADGIDNALQPFIEELDNGVLKARFMCEEMYYPDGAKTSRCVMKNGNWQWTNSFADNRCVTCDNRPDVGGVDVDQIDCQEECLW